MDQALSDLIKISNTTGSDTTLVQGGGGNTSAKTSDGKYMYIKASGTALKDMDKKSGWRKMLVEEVLGIISDKKLDRLDAQKRESEVVNRLMLACCDEDKANARPSVEAHLHAMLGRYVIHLHPDAVGAYVNARDGQAELEKLFKDEKNPPLWVPYMDPGLQLARKIQRLIEQHEQENNVLPQMLFLEKHGLFVTASSPDAAVRIVRRVIRKCNSKLKQLSGKLKKVDPEYITETKMAIRAAFYKATGSYNCVKHYYDEQIASFLGERNAKKMLSAGPITPDELIYANGAAMYLEKVESDRIASSFTSMLISDKKLPAAFAVKDAGLFIVADEKMCETIKDVAKTSMFIRANAWRMGGIAALNKRQQEFILNWESESFRKSLVAGGSNGLLAGRVAIVTGAGSGLGRSIAQGLARDGATVAIADIDEAAAGETVELICKEIAGSQAMAVKCNVTSEEDVKAGFDKILDRWGGIDILVNAAGVAPAYPLQDTPVDKWRLALEINLTGYMLMAKIASGLMIKQGMGGSIVNISSKSGIDASKNNSAYNATKAGELHLTRGWAMELGPHNIRVNSVCPGNVFEGSKIWNPTYIKQCAKKYGIKPDEVIPYYVNKTMLKLEIKGSDIANAVAFLSSDKARRVTAQTLVVDAGQAMVR